MEKTTKEILQAIEDDALEMDSAVLEQLKKLEEANYSELKELDKNGLIEEILKRMKTIEEYAKSMYIKYESLK